MFAVLSYQGAAADKDFGAAYWRLEIRGPQDPDRLVRTSHGMVRIDARGAAVGEFFWDGRDEDGNLVEPGKYQYLFSGRFLPDRIRLNRELPSFDDLRGLTGVVAAQETTRDVIVDYTLSPEASRSLRQSLVSTSCQIQQNASIEVGFPYNFYYGSTHSHSNFSDGGQPTTGCSSGNAYGSGTFTPALIYDFARNTAGMDYWVVNEHNHLINDSVATNNPPVTEAKVRQRYLDGVTQATAANVDGTFVAIYGMEWGVISGGGHVTVLDAPKLFGWESCAICTGPTAECTPGTDCYFDVFTPKSNYPALYAASVANPSSAGALGILCHPQSGDFGNYAFNSNADQALQGIAVRSGLAFSNATNCADANVGATNYATMWTAALDKGFHLGPTADNDSHCNNFGVALPTRTVYLVPSATGLTRAGILAAHKARHFYATEDSNVQLIFGTVGNAHIMGDIFTVVSTTALRAAVNDPNGETVATLELWRGQIGAGVPVTPILSVANQPTLSFTDTVTTGTYYYYIHGVQPDGHDFWSAPMWITYNLSGCTVPPSPTAGNNGPICAGQTLNLTASTIAGAAYSWTGPNLFTSNTQNPAISLATTAATGTYSVTATVAGCTSLAGSTSATVNACPAPTVNSISRACASTIGGLPVTITGNNFQTNATVTLAGTPATVTALSLTSITATTGSRFAAPALTGDVVVTNPDSQTGTLVGGFTYGVRGDANNSGGLTPSDASWLNDYFAGAGPPPAFPCIGGDANATGSLTPSDASYLNDYFAGVGPAPGP